jgi:F-type H+-transporting ATPase subunit a
MDFNIHVAKVINIFGVEVWITESMINAWIICGVIIIGALWIRWAIRDPQKVPSGVQNVIEFLVEGFNSFSASTMGKYGPKFSTFYLAMFIYILFCNLSGLFIGPNIVPSTPENPQLPFTFIRPPTADIAVTLSLALVTFFMTQGYGIKSKGIKAWLKGLTEPMFLLTPLNIIGELANPVSLSFRMFGNILGGTIIMGLYWNLPWFALLGIPVFLHGYFDVFAGVLQSFIFIMLSMTFVSGAME